MITIQVVNHTTGVSAIAEIADEFGPSLRSTVSEHANVLGEKQAGSWKFEKEDAFCRAGIAFNAFRAAVNRVIDQEDQYYE